MSAAPRFECYFSMRVPDSASPPNDMQVVSGICHSVFVLDDGSSPDKAFEFNYVQINEVSNG